MAFLVLGVVLPTTTPRRDHDPGVVVGEGLREVGGQGRWRSRCGCQLGELFLHPPQLLLDVLEQIQKWLWDRMDYVAVHVTLSISVYPRSSASGRLPGFGLAPGLPSGAEVLRARPAVIAGRAYGSKVHGDDVVRCLRRPLRAVPRS